MNEHNLKQRIGRLDREIRKFAATIVRVGAARTPQDRRALSLAMRCLNARVRDLKKLKPPAEGE